MMDAEIARLTTREPEKTFEEGMVAIKNLLSDFVCSEDREAGEDEDDEETEEGMLSKDDEPG